MVFFDYNVLYFLVLTILVDDSKRLPHHVIWRGKYAYANNLFTSRICNSHSSS